MFHSLVSSIRLLNFEHALHVEKKLTKKHYVLMTRILQVCKNVRLVEVEWWQILWFFVLVHQVKRDQELVRLWARFWRVKNVTSNLTDKPFGRVVQYKWLDFLTWTIEGYERSVLRLFDFANVRQYNNSLILGSNRRSFNFLSLAWTCFLFAK